MAIKRENENDDISYSEPIATKISRLAFFGGAVAYPAIRAGLDYRNELKNAPPGSLDTGRLFKSAEALKRAATKTIKLSDMIPKDAARAAEIGAFLASDNGAQLTSQILRRSFGFSGTLLEQDGLLNYNSILANSAVGGDHTKALAMFYDRLFDQSGKDIRKISHVHRTINDLASPSTNLLSADELVKIPGLTPTAPISRAIIKSNEPDYHQKVIKDAMSFFPNIGKKRQRHAERVEEVFKRSKPFFDKLKGYGIDIKVTEHAIELSHPSLQRPTLIPLTSSKGTYRYGGANYSALQFIDISEWRDFQAKGGSMSDFLEQVKIKDITSATLATLNQTNFVGVNNQKAGPADVLKTVGAVVEQLHKSTAAFAGDEKYHAQRALAGEGLQSAIFKGGGMFINTADASRLIPRFQYDALDDKKIHPGVVSMETDVNPFHTWMAEHGKDTFGFQSSKSRGSGNFYLGPFEKAEIGDDLYARTVDEGFIDATKLDPTGIPSNPRIDQFYRDGAFLVGEGMEDMIRTPHLLSPTEAKFLDSTRPFRVSINTAYIHGDDKESARVFKGLGLPSYLAPVDEGYVISSRAKLDMTATGGKQVEYLSSKIVDMLRPDSSINELKLGNIPSFSGEVSLGQSLAAAKGEKFQLAVRRRFNFKQARKMGREITQAILSGRVKVDDAIASINSSGEYGNLLQTRYFQGIRNDLEAFSKDAEKRSELLVKIQEDKKDIKSLSSQLENIRSRIVNAKSRKGTKNIPWGEAKHVRELLRTLNKDEKELEVKIDRLNKSKREKEALLKSLAPDKKEFSRSLDENIKSAFKEIRDHALVSRGETIGFSGDSIFASDARNGGQVFLSSVHPVTNASGRTMFQVGTTVVQDTVGNGFYFKNTVSSAVNLPRGMGGITTEIPAAKAPLGKHMNDFARTVFNIAADRYASYTDAEKALGGQTYFERFIAANKISGNSSSGWQTSDKQLPLFGDNGIFNLFEEVYRADHESGLLDQRHNDAIQHEYALPQKTTIDEHVAKIKELEALARMNNKVYNAEQAGSVPWGQGDFSSWTSRAEYDEHVEKRSKQLAGELFDFRNIGAIPVDYSSAGLQEHRGVYQRNLAKLSQRQMKILQAQGFGDVMIKLLGQGDGEEIAPELKSMANQLLAVTGKDIEGHKVPFAKFQEVYGQDSDIVEKLFSPERARRADAYKKLGGDIESNLIFEIPKEGKNTTLGNLVISPIDDITSFETSEGEMKATYEDLMKKQKRILERLYSASDLSGPVNEYVDSFLQNGTKVLKTGFGTKIKGSGYATAHYLNVGGFGESKINAEMLEYLKSTGFSAKVDVGDTIGSNEALQKHLFDNAVFMDDDLIRKKLLESGIDPTEVEEMMKNASTKGIHGFIAREPSISTQRMQSTVFMPMSTLKDWGLIDPNTVGYMRQNPLGAFMIKGGAMTHLGADTDKDFLGYTFVRDKMAREKIERFNRAYKGFASIVQMSSATNGKGFNLTTYDDAIKELKASDFYKSTSKDESEIANMAVRRLRQDAFVLSAYNVIKSPTAGLPTEALGTGKIAEMWGEAAHVEKAKIGEISVAGQEALTAVMLNPKLSDLDKADTASLLLLEEEGTLKVKHGNRRIIDLINETIQTMKDPTEGGSIRFDGKSRKEAIDKAVGNLVNHIIGSSSKSEKALEPSREYFERAARNIIESNLEYGDEAKSLRTYIRDMSRGEQPADKVDLLRTLAGRLEHDPELGPFSRATEKSSANSVTEAFNRMDKHVEGYFGHLKKHWKLAAGFAAGTALFNMVAGPGEIKAESDIYQAGSQPSAPPPETYPSRVPRNQTSHGQIYNSQVSGSETSAHRLSSTLNSQGRKGIMTVNSYKPERYPDYIYKKLQDES